MLNEVATDQPYPSSLEVLVGKSDNTHFPWAAPRLGPDRLLDPAGVLTCNKESEFQNALIAPSANLKRELCRTDILAREPSDALWVGFSETVDAPVIITCDKEFNPA